MVTVQLLPAFSLSLQIGQVKGEFVSELTSAVMSARLDKERKLYPVPTYRHGWRGHGLQAQADNRMGRFERKGQRNIRHHA